MKCIVCASATRIGLSPWHSSCPSCQYEGAQLSPSINQRQTHELLNEGDRLVSLKRLRAENFQAIVERLTSLVKPSATTLLDVGSAHGWFLEQASKRFRVMGIEPDVAVADTAVARGLPVRIGYFPDELNAGESFDVIVFNDVIEHIPDINSALLACQSRLNADGLLVLNLPNSRGFFYKLSKLLASLRWHGPFERMWQKGLPSPHVHYFNENNLSALVTRHGLKKVDTFALSSLSASGLLERLRYVGRINPLVLYAQYLAILCAIPVIKFFPSDIVVCVFRKPQAMPA